MSHRTLLGILALFLYFTNPLCAQESSPTDDIVIKSTNAVIFLMTANLKLTQEQINAVRPIIADNIAKTRNLEQELRDGDIDGKTMYSQRQQLIKDEDGQLSGILTQDQMKIWVNIQSR